jgi:CBS domain-containing protein
MVRVDQFMSSPVFTCSVRDDLNAAVALMWDHDCGVVPVVDDEGRLVGVVTDRDACMAAYTQGKPLREIAIDTVMSRQLATCRAEDPISLAEELMQAHQLRRIPVVDADNRPIGLLSVNDLARNSLRPSPARRGLLVTFATTLASICRPRTGKLELPRPPHGWEDYMQKHVRPEATVRP